VSHIQEIWNAGELREDTGDAASSVDTESLEEMPRLLRRCAWRCGISGLDP